MALVVDDRIKETTTTVNTSSYSLGGAVTGFQTFSDGVGNGNTTYYCCTDGTDYEIGLGTLSGTTLARTTILESSNNNLAISWSAGSKDIFCTLPASKAVFKDASNNVTVPNALIASSVDATTGGFDNLVLNKGAGFVAPIIWEGSTQDDYETTLNVVDPTADRTISLPDASGTVALNDVATTSANGLMSSSDKSKLNGVESGATADQTAAEILTAIKTVDGAASGLDADTLDGQHASAFLTEHPTISAAASSDNSGRTYIQDITLDSNGHVTNIATATETVVNTDTNTTSLAIENGSGTSQFTVTDTVGLEFAASGATSVAFDATNKRVTFSSTDNNTTYSAATTSTDGLMSSSDKTKLDGVESNATADQTGAEIKTAYENEADTNAFTDALLTKLNGIEASADVTDTANVTAAGALMDSEVTNLAQVKAFDASNFATWQQGNNADAALLRTGGTMTGNIVMSGAQTVDGRDLSVDGAKLDGIEANADVTDATNVQAAGALMDSELAYEAAVKAINQDLSTTGIVQFLSVQAPTVYIPNAGGSGLLFEGSTADTYETSVVATDPTADRTITLPDSDGTVVLLDSLGDLTFEMADANKNIVFDKSANSLHFNRPTGSDAYGKSGEILFGTFSNAKIFDEATSGASNNGFNIVDSGKIHFDAPNITYRSGDASGEETLETTFTRSGTSYSWNQYHQPEFDPSTYPTFCWNHYNLYTAVAAEILYTVDYGSNTSFDANGLEFILDKEQDTVADNDDIALIIFRGNNSVAGNHEYAKITATMQDVTDDTEDGILKFSVSRDGSFADYFQLDGQGNHTLFFKPIAFEGSTADDFETTLDVVDPTQDNSLNLPNESGTIATRAHAVALASVLG